MVRNLLAQPETPPPSPELRLVPFRHSLSRTFPHIPLPSLSQRNRSPWSRWCLPRLGIGNQRCQEQHQFVLVMFGFDGLVDRETQLGRCSREGQVTRDLSSRVRNLVSSLLMDYSLVIVLNGLFPSDKVFSRFQGDSSRFFWFLHRLFRHPSRVHSDSFFNVDQ